MSDGAPDVGLAGRKLLDESDKQVVLDAAAALQVRRSEIAGALAAGPVPHAHIVTSSSDNATLNRPLMEQSASWRELHSVLATTSVPQLRLSLPNNRRILEGGLRMESIFDATGLAVGPLLLLANEPVGDYLVSFAPLNMKIIDRRSVLLQGPHVPGSGPSVMEVRSAACLEAAWRYWVAVRRFAVPVKKWAGGVADLTPRQRQVVALMASGLGDDAIADTLGVSVRTVRADIAALLDVLGVRTRFAAGVRLQLWPDPGDDG
ncbi:helix-turn-helix transcriptional regulator [Nocardioides aquiterrae]|uniref:HTH luxR-type domain-containing protein n=1 Tax=Nocardioides aquiterrae TaxID=203799 RepID=A0ABN1UL34_9ACTN